MKKGFLKNKCLHETCCEVGLGAVNDLKHRPGERPWMSMKSSISFFTFKSPCSHAFLEAILKNQGHNFHPICSLSLHEHWQIVIFWPRSQRRVVRGRRADKRLLPFTPAHYWAFRPRSTNPKAPHRGYYWSCDWQLAFIQSSLKI